MEIFIDTENIDEIKKYSKFGIVDGVTTNPALIAKEGKNFNDVLEEICDIIDGPISAEVVSTDAKNMIKEGKLISKRNIALRKNKGLRNIIYIQPENPCPKIYPRSAGKPEKYPLAKF